MASRKRVRKFSLVYFWRINLSKFVYLWHFWYNSCQRYLSNDQARVWSSVGSPNGSVWRFLMSWTHHFSHQNWTLRFWTNQHIFVEYKGAGIRISINSDFPATMEVSKFTQVFICMMTCMNKVETSYRQVFQIRATRKLWLTIELTIQAQSINNPNRISLPSPHP